MPNPWSLLLCCVLSSLVALAQNTSSPSSSPWRYPNSYRGDKATATAAPVEISFGYSYLRANGSPDQCGCFHMDGGSTEVAFHLYRWFSAVTDLTGERSGSLNGGAQDCPWFPLPPGRA